MPLAGVLGATAWMALVGGDRANNAAGVGHFLAQHPVSFFLALQLSVMALDTTLWLCYRPAKPRDDRPLPSVTVVIPAYNEGAMVERSIQSVAASDYPHDRLEVLVVDDGSRDDTWFHMEHLRRRFPDLVRLLRFRGNRGKRAGLHAGVLAARGEVIVTLDSDSEVLPDTLRALVAPLVDDPRVGAVAGRVSVLDRSTLIGAMLDVQFSLAFDFGRAAQSTMRTVWCCPGALSALRRDVILPHLDEWLDQRFLGLPVNHGEDQALTNIILRAGYDTVYQRSAVVQTLTPRTYRQLYRMLLRWERSYVVEGLTYARFMFGRSRRGSRVLPVLHFVLSNVRLLVTHVGICTLPWLILQRPSRLINYAAALAVGAVLTAAYYLRTRRGAGFLFGVVYAFYSFLLLQWIFPWAVVTVRDERWGTR